MRKAFMVLAVALIALPIFAEQKTPTPVSQRVRIKQGGQTVSNRVVQPTVTPTPSGERTTTINNSKSNNLKVAGTVTPTAGPLEVVKIKSTKSDASLRVGMVTPTREPLEGTTVKGSKSNSDNRIGPPTVTPTGEPLEATTIKGSKSNSSERLHPDLFKGTMTGKVISQSGNTFTILANGKEAIFSAAKLKDVPKVGETVDISYTQTPGGLLEVAKIKSTKSNASE